MSYGTETGGLGQDMNRAGSATVANRQPLVAAALCQLDKEVAQLHQSIDLLYKRLEPVCSQSPASPPSNGAGNSPEPTCELASRIQALRRGVHGAFEKVEALTHSIEI